MYLWWSQDGAPYHQLIAVREVLNEFFVNPVISLCSTQQSFRSSYLIPCFFFLWGYLKNKVFTTPQ